MFQRGTTAAAAIINANIIKRHILLSLLTISLLSCTRRAGGRCLRLVALTLFVPLRQALQYNKPADPLRFYSVPE